MPLPRNRNTTPSWRGKFHMAMKLTDMKLTDGRNGPARTKLGDLPLFAVPVQADIPQGALGGRKGTIHRAHPPFLSQRGTLLLPSDPFLYHHPPVLFTNPSILLAQGPFRRLHPPVLFPNGPIRFQERPIRFQKGPFRLVNPPNSQQVTPD